MSRLQFPLTSLVLTVALAACAPSKNGANPVKTAASGTTKMAPESDGPAAPVAASGAPATAAPVNASKTAAPAPVIDANGVETVTVTATKGAPILPDVAAKITLVKSPKNQTLQAKVFTSHGTAGAAIPSLSYACVGSVHDVVNTDAFRTELSVTEGSEILVHSAAVQIPGKTISDIACDGASNDDTNKLPTLSDKISSDTKLKAGDKAVQVSTAHIAYEVSCQKDANAGVLNQQEGIVMLPGSSMFIPVDETTKIANGAAFMLITCDAAPAVASK